MTVNAMSRWGAISKQILRLVYQLAGQLEQEVIAGLQEPTQEDSVVVGDRVAVYAGKRSLSSHGRGTWKHCLALRSRAPANWYGRKAAADPAPSDTPKDQARGGPLHRQVDAHCRRRARARLLVKAHSIEVLARPRCGSPMAVIAAITDPAQIRKATGAALGIIACLDRHGRGPPHPGWGSTPPRR